MQDKSLLIPLKNALMVCNTNAEQCTSHKD